MKVAVVRNRKNDGIISRFGQPCPEVYGRRSVQRVMDALRADGHTVKVFEANMSLLPALKEFMPPETEYGTPGGLVFNLAYGIQGESRYVHLPATLEMAGVPYTGAGPLGHALSLDKVVAKMLMREVGVPTPRSRTMSSPSDDPGDLRFPLVVKPRHESTSYGLSFVRHRRELADAVEMHVNESGHDQSVAEVSRAGTLPGLDGGNALAVEQDGSHDDLAWGHTASENPVHGFALA